MKAYEVIDRLIHYSKDIHDPTVDTLKEGDPDKSVSKVGFCHTITPEVLKSAVEWGADVLITHEPTYYDHFDNYSENIISKQKKAMVASSGITVFRFHDHAHYSNPDIIHSAFLEMTGLKGEYDGQRILKLSYPMSATEVAKIISDKMLIKHPRLIGNLKARVTNIALCLGACGDLAQNVVLEGKADMVICGEFCEWRSGEYFRDAAQMGMPFSLIAIGHVCSERYGMRLASEKFFSDCPEIQTKYFDCGDLIKFID